MTIITSTEFRKDMAKYVRESSENKTPIYLTTQKQPTMVLIPLEEWEALQETQYLLASPKNQERLDKAVKDIRAQKYTAHDITEACD